MAKGTDIIFGAISTIAFFSVVHAFFNFFSLPIEIVNTIYYGGYFVLFFAMLLTVFFAYGNVISALILSSLVSGGLFICLSVIAPAIA